MRRRVRPANIAALLALLLLAAPAAGQDATAPPAPPANEAVQPPTPDVSAPAEPPRARSGAARDLAGPNAFPDAAPEAAVPLPPGTQPATPLQLTPSNGATEDAAAGGIVTVDQEAMYRQSLWGRRAQAELAVQTRQVAADNDRAFAALVADEDALTDARANLPPEAFRLRAAEFDQRVTAIRAERDAAREALQDTAELDRALFFQAAAPVLGRVMISRGALVVLDQRTVLIANERIDVTAETIAALDRELGDGRDVVAAALRAQAEAERARDRAETAGTGDELPDAADAVTPDTGPDADPSPDPAGQSDSAAADVPLNGSPPAPDAGSP